VHLDFRPDVEGMRAVAVVAVVLYHAGVTSGGFVGVDMFFVLSGFLITGLLWRELEGSGRLAFASFYGRRARRLLPASVLVLVVTTIASVHWLPPLQAHDVTNDAKAAALYVANYRFIAQRTNYLAATAPSPLQHYWSLGVEEQFYLLWPLLLLLAARAARRAKSSRRAPETSKATLAAIVAAMAALSFLLSLRLTHTSQPWAFFSLPTRAWELLAGALVALALTRARELPRLAAAAIGWAGLIAVLWSVFRLSGATPFPGTAALVPVLGTVGLLVAGSAAPKRGVSHALSRQPLQRIGRISYSWYLWHWPVLVLAPAVVGHTLATWQNLFLALASAFLAVATTNLLENRIRFSRALSLRPARSLALGAALTCFALVSVVVAAGSIPSLRGSHAIAALKPVSDNNAPLKAVALTPTAAAVANAYAQVAPAVAASANTRAVPSNLDPSLDKARASEALPFTDGCDDSFTDSTVHHCVYGDPNGNTTVMLFGDSHAAHWFPAFDTIARARNWRLIDMSKATCPPMPIPIYSPVLGRNYTECDEFRQNAMARIAAEHPALVFIDVARSYGPEYHFQVFANSWVDSMRTLVSQIRAMGPRVMVMSATPRPDGDLPNCLSANLNNVAACTPPTGTAVDANGLAAEQAAVQAAGGRFVNVTPLLCTPHVCPPIIGNVLVYRDDNHLTTEVADWLAPVMTAEVDATLPVNEP
jgi:peptidoglycan/LPS O-acetylase OafA/YrhL